MAYLKGRFTEGNLEKYKSYVYSNKVSSKKEIIFLKNKILAKKMLLKALLIVT